MVRGLNPPEPYWRRVLEYCVDGCLQAVLDEYMHVLLDAQGLAVPKKPLFADEFEVGPEGVAMKKEGLRARFALRHGSETGEDGRQMRHTHVQGAFNSPFWPFVLASTSVGQEGLDFHPYCHAMVHWVPSNPVDMEQREGRVHRY